MKDVSFFTHVTLYSKVVVYHLYEKTIWLEIVQMERKNSSWTISFGVCAFHLP